ncbi:ERVV2 protein, partial [Alopecoenas beccarii]|nr:ERVV2 protein [Alopecoenas beccarii]
TVNIGGVCTLINTNCCTYIDKSKEIETDIQKIWEHAEVLHQVAQDDTTRGFQELWEKLTSWLLNFGWLKQLFVLVIMLIVLGLLICILLRCFLCCTKGAMDSYTQWKKHQL